MNYELGFVVDPAGEGGPCGVVLLAAYQVWKSENETLEVCLTSRVFAGVSYAAIQPDVETAVGFNPCVERYRAPLDAERKAAEVL